MENKVQGKWVLRKYGDSVLSGQLRAEMEILGVTVLK